MASLSAHIYHKGCVFMKRIIRNIIVLSVLAATPLSLFLSSSKASAASLNYLGTVKDTLGNSISGANIYGVFTGQDNLINSVEFPLIGKNLSTITNGTGEFSLSSSVVPDNFTLNAGTIEIEPTNITSNGFFPVTLTKVGDSFQGSNTFTVNASPTTSVPEPSFTLGVLAFGAFLGTGWMLKFKRKGVREKEDVLRAGLTP